MRKRQPVRQGDVLLVPIKDVPAGCRPVSRVGGRIILAEGEVTGHHHAISDAEVDLVIGDLERRFLEVGPAGATLAHEEHAGIAVAPGKWEVVIQVEYTPTELRQVAD